MDPNNRTNKPKAQPSRTHNHNHHNHPHQNQQHHNPTQQTNPHKKPQRSNLQQNRSRAGQTNQKNAMIVCSPQGYTVVPAKVQPKSPKRANTTAPSPLRSLKPFKPSGHTPEEEALLKIKDFHTRSPYAEDIHDTHKMKEASQKLVDFMSAQPEITPQMRSILVDWLGEVSEEYDLAPDTLFLAVNYIDRFLSACVVQRCQLQLVGITCMLIACKYEEIQAPFVEDFVHITDCTYTREEILKTELYILNKLDFSLTVCTIRNFLPRFMCLAEMDHEKKATFLSQYLSELCLSIHHINQGYPPSLIASAVVFITRAVLRSSEQWPLVLKYYTGYSAMDLKNCVMDICAAHGVANSNGKNPSSKDKYTSLKYEAVSLINLSVADFQF